MVVDLGVFERQKTIVDQQQLQDAFELKKALAAQQLIKTAKGGDLPAPIQLANEFQAARQSGDIQRMNDIAQFAKIYDRGVSYDPNIGGIAPISGYGQAIGSIEAAKGGMKRQAESNVDLSMKPQIGQRTAFSEALGKGAADAVNTGNKKTVAANNMMGLIDEAESLLPKASSGIKGSVGAGLKGTVGYSDEATQADKQLGVIAAGLVSNVPRMEGPQSDRDVMMYREAAGDIANISKPRGDRLAALKTIRQLQQKYASPVNSMDDVLNNYQQGAKSPAAAGGWSVKELP